MPGRAMLRLWLGMVLVGSGIFSLEASAAQGEGRFEQLTKKFHKTPDQARVLSAGYLGGPGTEWLVGGGFQPDGTVVVAGVALGPTLELMGRKAEVLGQDAPPPASPERKQQLDRNGKPVTDKAGTPKYEPFGWKHANATAFVALLSADLKQVRSVHRFPWKSAGLTSAVVAETGHIYLAGPATEGIRALGGDQKEIVVEKSSPDQGSSRLTYLACLSSDAGKVNWVRTFKGPSSGPVLELAGPGRVRVLGPHARTFDAQGRQQSVTVVPSLGPRVALNPRDDTIARGGEHPWRTGREPYRDPILNIYRPDGSWLYELYNWDGPFVGLDNLRLVSDSAVRGVRYDADGNLVLSCWSDGGNSVFYREPNDIRRVSKAMDGLGMSAWGSGVLSCAYLIRIETRNCKVTAGTPWLAYLQSNNPNSIWVDSLGLAPDGSIGIGGRSAWGLIQTGNKLSQADPAGNYVAVLSKDCKSLRFSSALPACGQTDVCEGARWGIVSGTVDGRPRLLFLGGASQSEEVYGKVHPAPQAQALQSRFGGGHTDGYLLVLDLSANSKPDRMTGGPSTFSHSRRLLVSLNEGEEAEKKIKLPAAGTEFRFSPDQPKYVTCDIEFRDPAEVFWPCFFYGRPAASTRITYDPSGPTGSFSLLCDQMVQKNGDQSRRILGELVKDGKPPLIRLTVKELGKLQTEMTEAGSKASKKPQEFALARGELDLGGKKIPVEARTSYSWKLARGNEGAESVAIELRFRIKGADLGLTRFRGPIECRAGLTGFAKK